MKQKISTDQAPNANHILSQAVLSDKQYTLDISGFTGKDPETGTLVDGGFSKELHQVIQNISAVLAEVGRDLTNITKMRIFITDPQYYPQLNEIYQEYFTHELLPARFAIVVKDLPGGALVELDATARGDSINT